ncbi:MAG: DNA-directed RNA polymerase specialized sigma24 family protein [Candidatus Latescibacterota bacterium]|jgi:DNA-directed RNA polymerase specialized sigma24 family protein
MACQELYEIYSEELRQYLARTLRDTAVVDDLLQELLLRVWNRGG